MRKLILKINMSLDGFVGSLDGKNEWFFAGSTEESRAWLVRTLEEAGTHAIGSNSFVSMAGFYPTSTLPFAPAMNGKPKVVFSRSGKTKAIEDAMNAAPATPAGTTWKEARIASGNLREEIEKLKAEPGGPILAQAGAKFARALIASGLVDEYRLVTNPVALGKGEPLFSELPAPLKLAPVDTITFPTGLVIRILRPT